MRTQRRLCSLCRASDVRLCRVPGQELSKTRQVSEIECWDRNCQKLGRSARSSAGTGIVKNLAGQRDRVLGQELSKTRQVSEIECWDRIVKNSTGMRRVQGQRC